MRALIGKFAVHVVCGGFFCFVVFFKGRKEDQGEEEDEILKFCIQSIVPVG